MQGVNAMSQIQFGFPGVMTGHPGSRVNPLQVAKVTARRFQ